MKQTEKNALLIPIKDCRSRHAKFISFYYCNHLEFNSHAIRRDLEPSRLQLTRAFNKSRAIRRTLRKKTATVPMSSNIHYINRCSLGKKKMHVDEDNRCLCKPGRGLINTKSKYGLEN